MKPIKLNPETKDLLLKTAMEDVVKTLDEYEFNINQTKITYQHNISVKAKEKIIIQFTPQAFIRCLQMVKNFSSEIGWYGLIRKLDERRYQVYDIIVCNQKVNGGRVITDDDDMIKFYESLTDEQAEFLHFQAHSHVSMATTPSGVDIENQTSTVKNMGGKGFYLFQIWNKSLEINSFLYDLDHNIFFDKDDIEIVIEDSEYGSINEFLESLKDKVVNMTYTNSAKSTYNYSSYQEKDYSKVKSFEDFINREEDKVDKKKEEENKKERPEGSTWYWNDGLGHEGWD